MIQKKYSDYKTFIFDCDGVLLNSNKIKTKAFKDTVLEFSEESAQELAKYNKDNGGISRRDKFEYYLKNIIYKYSNKHINIDIDYLINKYSKIVKKELLKCEIAKDIELLGNKCKDKSVLVVSGSDQSELRYVFKKRGIEYLFPNGIFGSPDDKKSILKRELEIKNIVMPALFLGDSKYDYESANLFNIDFLFINKWTEVSEWELWCKEKEISFKASISEFIKFL